LIESTKKSNLKKARSRRDPLWNKIPSYSTEALISSINDIEELTLALQSEYREKSSSEREARHFKKPILLN